MWRHCPRQNVASLVHMASASQVASPNVASGRQVASPVRGVREPGWRCKIWRQNVASCAHVATRSQKWRRQMWRMEPGGVTRCGVKTWRLAHTWRQQAGGIAGAVPGFTPMASRYRTWRQRATWASPDVASNVAPGAIDLRGVARRGVNRWRQEAEASQQVSSKRFLRHRAIQHPSGDPPDRDVIIVSILFICHYAIL